MVSGSDPRDRGPMLQMCRNAAQIAILVLRLGMLPSGSKIDPCSGGPPLRSVGATSVPNVTAGWFAPLWPKSGSMFATCEIQDAILVLRVRTSPLWPKTGPSSGRSGDRPASHAPPSPSSLFLLLSPWKDEGTKEDEARMIGSARPRRKRGEQPLQHRKTGLELTPPQESFAATRPTE